MLLPKLINFENDSAVDEILRNCGFTVGLGEFLAAHLIEVLRKQHQTAEIESIELLQVEPCTLSGMQDSDSKAILAERVSIPSVVAVVVVVGEQKLKLKLRVVIRVAGQDGKYTNAETDVFVLEQSNI